MHPNEALSRSLRLIPPSPPANLPPRIPHELRTTQSRRSPACPPAGDAAPKSSPFHRQILLPVSPTGSARHRADARRPAPPRRATPHRRAAFSAAVTGHRPRPASAAVPGCPLRLRRQTAPRQNNPASAVALRSVCTIFTEDRRHLGKTTSQAGCFCSRFVLSLPQTNLAI